MIQIKNNIVTMTKTDLDELNGEIEAREKAVIELESQLKDCREYLAVSISKECKCESNTIVNEEIILRNTKLREEVNSLKEQLKEANEVIGLCKNSIGFALGYGGKLKKTHNLVFDDVKGYLTKYKLKE